MKAQAFSLDFVVAVTILIFLMGIITFVWFAIPSTRILDMQGKANAISDYLVVQKFGDENVLICPKISLFSLEDYATIKDDLHVGPYDIWVQFMNTTVMCDGNQTYFGVFLNNTSQTASVARIVLVDGNKMQMIVKLYV